MSLDIIFFFVQPLLIRSKLGTPDETVWPGVTSLPDFKTSFPKWPIKDAKSLATRLCEDGARLLEVNLTQFCMYGNPALVSVSRSENRGIHFFFLIVVFVHIFV